VAKNGAKVTADDIAAHLDQIRKLDGYSVPNSIGDELQLIMKALKG
jgi:hypothetical protein